MGNMINLTEEEKRYISRYLNNRSNARDTVFIYGAYMLPSLLFAIYALFKQDFLAALVAYIALFVVVVLYLSYVRKSSDVFRPILAKLEGVTIEQLETPEASE